MAAGQIAIHSTSSSLIWSEVLSSRFFVFGGSWEAIAWAFLDVQPFSRLLVIPVVWNLCRQVEVRNSETFARILGSSWEVPGPDGSIHRGVALRASTPATQASRWFLRGGWGRCRESRRAPRISVASATR